MQQGIEEFTKRLSKYFDAGWQIIAPPKNAASLPEAILKKQEAELVLQQIKESDYIILLDERGKQFTSPELAGFIQRKANENIKRLVFVIAGAFGAAEALQQKANFTWSLSKLVFPHMLVRLILAEQLYRACTILKNEKYHHQ